MTIVVAPTYSGITGVDQFVVPVAAPEVPSDVVHVTDTTPVLSVAMPATTREDAVVT
jgi:hypothetical protein